MSIEADIERIRKKYRHPIVCILPQKPENAFQLGYNLAKEVHDLRGSAFCIGDDTGCAVYKGLKKYMEKHNLEIEFFVLLPYWIDVNPCYEGVKIEHVGMNFRETKRAAYKIADLV